MVSEKQIDKAMKLLIEWHGNEHNQSAMPESAFKSKTGKAVYSALLAEKLVESRIAIRTISDGKRESFDCCSLTDKGRLYFIEKQKQQRISRWQFVQSVAIAIISAVVSTILTLFVSQRSDGSETSSS